MQAVLESIKLDEFNSLAVREYAMPAFDAPWHFHPELELTLILEGVGERFVGDSIQSYGPGDLVLLGANLPHFWRTRFVRGMRSHAIVIHFRESIFPPAVPEFQPIRALLTRALVGISFTREDKEALIAAVRGIVEASGASRIIRFYDFFNRLNQETAREELASPAHLSLRDEKSIQRLNKAATYIFANLADPIRLGDVAEVAGMSDAAFCRYFKRNTGRTLTGFIAELRVSEACKRLMESDLSIAEVAFEVGFGSLSNFNRIFREQKNMSPREYRQAREGAGPD